MKKFLVGVVLVLGSVGFGTTPEAELPLSIVNSAAPLEGAIDAVADSVITTYIPGYGLQISTELFNTQDDVLPMSHLLQLADLIKGLSGTVQGLKPNDFVSATMLLTFYQGDNLVGSNLLVRMKPGQPATLEGWWDDIKIPKINALGSEN